MREVKQISIKNLTYYFYNDMINVKDFDAKLLKLTKNHTKTLSFTTYITKKKIDDYENIYSVNLLYLIIANASGYIQEKNRNKYLIFDSVDENKESLKKYSDVWNGIKNKMKEVDNSECDYEKDYMKTKFNSDNNLRLNKPLRFHNMTIRSVFEEEGKLYPQLVLEDTLYELDA